MTGKLILKDGTIIEGKSFGYKKSVSGEVVFSTGMVGYPESMTDPSYKGQILVLTYPLVGNYGVSYNNWESPGIKITGLIVSTYNETPSHFESRSTLADWLIKEKIPALEINDTRYLAKKIRTTGVILGKIEFNQKIEFIDPNLRNLVEEVSVKKPFVEDPLRRLADGKGKKTIILIDCGVKRNIQRLLLKRNIRLITVPWNYDIFSSKGRWTFSPDAIVISNGPGDPKMVKETIKIVKKAIDNKIPTFGICLGNQILALAAGGDTYKLKFGHRGQNQPCGLIGSNKNYLTTQNHGFAVGTIPKGYKPWFVNLNDNTNEGIIHTKYPFMSAQFHPEVNPGPMDTEWLFDFFLDRV